MSYAIDNFTLIFGAMKCGTTSLFNYLAEHPQISACKSKEPNFFTHEKSWRKGIRYYRTLWEYNPGIHSTAMEASINYSKIPRLPNAAERIYNMALDKKLNFKLIYIIRNPIDRIISHCIHDLEEQWSIRYKHLIVHGIPYPAIEASKYAMQLDEYYKRFSAGNILLLKADDLKVEPQKVLNQICHFLEIDDSFHFSNFAKQHNRSEAKQPTNQFWPIVDKYLASPLIHYLPRARREQTMRMVRGWFRVEQEQRTFKLSEMQHDFIMEELRSDIQRLSSDYGVNIAQWGLEI